MTQFGINVEQSMHILAFPSYESFKIELVSQLAHKELLHVLQFVILVHAEQLIKLLAETNPY